MYSVNFLLIVITQCGTYYRSVVSSEVPDVVHSVLPYVVHSVVPSVLSTGHMFLEHQGVPDYTS